MRVIGLDVHRSMAVVAVLEKGHLTVPRHHPHRRGGLHGAWEGSMRTSRERFDGRCAGRHREPP
jgi:hypothetical protein